MHRQREDGVENVEEPHGDFEEPEEHAHDADVEIEVCVAGKRVSFRLACTGFLIPEYAANAAPLLRCYTMVKDGSTYKLLHTTGVFTGR